MQNDKKNRTVLKSYFKSNAVPTEQNFKDLIDAGLNQKDDGIAKLPEGALAIQSASTTEELIHFYKSFNDDIPTWRLSQRPGDKSGFSISDGAGTSRLFIDSGNGNIGLGLTTPAAKLDVQTTDSNGVLVRSGNGSSGSANSQLTFGSNGTAQYRHAIKTRHNAAAAAGNAIDFYTWKQGTDNENTVGTQQVMSLDGNGNVGIGITTPSARLHVAASGTGPLNSGVLAYNTNDSASQDAYLTAKVAGPNAGNPMLSLDVKGQGGWTVGVDNKDSLALKISAAWDSLASAKMTILRASGNVGIGVSPLAKLDVNTLDNNGVLIRSGNLSNGSANSQLTFGYNSTAQYRHAIKTRHNSGAQAGNAIDFYLWKQGSDGVDAIGTQQVMTIDGNGNVGVGTTTPSAKLQIISSGLANPPENGIYVYNPGTTRSDDAIIAARTNNSGSGNPFLSLDIAGIAGWSIGIDNADSQALKFSNAWNKLSANTRMTIQTNGRVGIGTTTPKAMLHVYGSVNTGNLKGNGASIDNNNYYNGWDNNVNADLSILADNVIGTRTFFVCHENILTGSDARIKNIVSRSNIQEDLATLCKLQITDYTHIDTKTHGTGIRKKVIAQEVEEVFPLAVKQRTEIIPDIYAEAISTSYDTDKKQLTIELEKAPELAAGDKVEIVTADGRDLHEVLSVEGTVFTVKSEKEITDVFVYGKEVNDFRFVDYDGLFMLSISSIQAINQEMTAMKKEISSLKLALETYTA